ncbi:MAG: hypothetical protein ACYSTS_09785 [Planctomycetota bacterium]
MLILTWKLVNSFTIVSESTTQEIHQSFSCILLLLLPTNAQFEQNSHSCTHPAESLPDKCPPVGWTGQAGHRTGKQETEGLYSDLTFHGKQSYFFPYLTKQSPEF